MSGNFATMTDPAKIAEFVAVTGVNEGAAKFYLDSSSGDLETAVNQFFATGGVQDDVPEQDMVDEPAPAASQPGDLENWSSQQKLTQLPYNLWPRLAKQEIFQPWRLSSA